MRYVLCVLFKLKCYHKRLSKNILLCDQRKLLFVIKLSRYIALYMIFGFIKNITTKLLFLLTIYTHNLEVLN